MMLSNFLPGGGNGNFQLAAVAVDTSGHEAILGIKTITCDNADAVKPFGAIDTPSSGGTASGGGYRNSGWVLTPLPNRIPTDGSTINVYVNGVDLGHPVYNIYRSDIASLFPGYNNSNGAHAYLDIDTTLYDNGVHTIAWIATDNAGNSDGIGSRYFSINNSQNGRTREEGRGTRDEGGQEERFPGFEMMSVAQETPGAVQAGSTRRVVGVVKGYGKDIEPRRVYPDDEGMVTMEIKPMERVVLHLSPGSASYTGYLKVGNRLRPLPAGSFLDKKRNVYYWQPGPGFLGRFHLVFFESNHFAEKKRKDILITIAIH